MSVMAARNRGGRKAAGRGSVAVLTPTEEQRLSPSVVLRPLTLEDIKKYLPKLTPTKGRSSPAKKESPATARESFKSKKNAYEAGATPTLKKRVRQSSQMEVKSNGSNVRQKRSLATKEESLSAEDVQRDAAQEFPRVQIAPKCYDDRGLVGSLLYIAYSTGLALYSNPCGMVNVERLQRLKMSITVGEYSLSIDNSEFPKFAKYQQATSAPERMVAAATAYLYGDGGCKAYSTEFRCCTGVRNLHEKKVSSVAATRKRKSH